VFYFASLRSFWIGSRCRLTSTQLENNILLMSVSLWLTEPLYLSANLWISFMVSHESSYAPARFPGGQALFYWLLYLCEMCSRIVAWIYDIQTIFVCQEPNCISWWLRACKKKNIYKNYIMMFSPISFSVKIARK
jgi:hypothetical protein